MGSIWSLCKTMLAHTLQRRLGHFWQKLALLCSLAPPPQLPDVNPIENVWAWIKQEHTKRFPMFPRNRDELIDQVFEIWNSLPDEWFKPYARSVVHWVNAVLKAKGSNTKY